MINRIIAYGFGFAATAPDVPRLIPTYGFTPFIPVIADVGWSPQGKAISWAPAAKDDGWAPQGKSVGWSPQAKD